MKTTFAIFARVALCLLPLAAAMPASTASAACLDGNGNGVINTVADCTGSGTPFDCCTGAGTGTCVAEQCDGGSCCVTTGTPSGRCLFRPSSFTCRIVAGVCDTAENCSGTSSVCPGDSFAATSVPCRADAGLCDVAENCSGTAAACPADAVEPSSTPCRSAAGVCDVAENCTGTSNTCPGDTFAATSVVCRADAGLCDIAENCPGNAAACPANGFEPTTTVCRADAGQCDVAENCNGAGACPADAFEPAATACGNPTDTACDDPDSCDGGGNCVNNFASSATVCRDAVGDCDLAENCDGAGTCPGDSFQPIDTACGDPTDTICDAADTCDGDGNCEDNLASAATLCRDAAGECDLAENCDGAGECATDEFVAVDTACGDPGESICDHADTCDGAGACQDNLASSATLCRDDAGDCDVPENCDGLGACAADEYEPADTACGDPTDTICDRADTCDGSGACQDNLEPGTTVCRADAGDCDVAESCDGAGECPSDSYEPADTACGDSTDTICNGADTCDGSGSCLDNFAPDTTECRADAGQCDVAESCDGAGACPADAFEPEDTACGNPSESICDHADSCDGNGVCDQNFEPAATLCRGDAGDCDVPESCDGLGACPGDAFEPEDTACGDPTDTICDGADTCDGDGACQDNFASAATLCRDDAGDCDVPEECDGSGACPADAYEPEDTACGDSSDTVCDHADTCDGDGACQPNFASAATLCRDDAGECDVPDNCDGSGACSADAFEPEDTACGDSTDTICDHADTCDGDGACQDNFASAATLCRDDAGECDVPEECDGAGACPADSYEPEDTACGDSTDTICDHADTCDGDGTCQSNFASSATLCRDDAGDCDLPENCDGAGACAANVFEPEDTACGDSSETICDHADSCDDSGNCQDNFASSATLCRDDAGECDVPENCDGAGACAADAFEPEDTACGDSTDAICDHADTCDGDGTCQDNLASSATLCRDDAGDCDLPENCDGAGACAGDVYEPADTACGDSTSTACDGADTCDGSGACQDNLASSETLCRDAVGDCDIAENCDGAGACATDVFVAAEEPCGDSSDSICDHADTCDGSGTCQDNVESAATLCRAADGDCDLPENCDGSGSCAVNAFVAEDEPCGDTDDTICDDPDTCDGNGTCEPNYALFTTTCREAVGDCDAPESCDGSGTCAGDVYEPADTPCGDTTDSICDGADTCDGENNCVDNIATADTLCRAADGDCDLPENCDGSGSCAVNVFVAEEAPCGNTTSTDCDGPDTCDGNGTCDPNPVADGNPCDDGLYCNGDDTCETGACTEHDGDPCVGADGDGNCAESCNEGIDSCTAPDPNGSACNDGDVCTSGETCSAGTCTNSTPTDCDDGIACTADSCDPEDGCVNVEAPQDDSLCYLPGAYALTVRDTGLATKREMKWTWRKGEAVDPADFGSPLTTTTYTLCVFDHSGGVPELVGTYEVPPSASFWQTGPKRIKYFDGAGSADGVTRIRGRAASAGKSKMRVKTRGANFTPPTQFTALQYFEADPDVTVQLINSEGVCWSSHYGPGIIRKNNGEFFKAIQP